MFDITKTAVAGKCIKKDTKRNMVFSTFYCLAAKRVQIDNAQQNKSKYHLMHPLELLETKLIQMKTIYWQMKEEKKLQLKHEQTTQKETKIK